MLQRLRDWSFFDAPARVLAVVSLCGLAAFVVGAYAVGELGLLHDRYTASAVFGDSGGLKPGAEVRVAGVVVGEVSSVAPDFSRGQVVVTFEVDREVDLGQQTSARIAPNTVLGGFHLRLSGPVEPPFLADLPVDERRIPLGRTDLSFTIVDALEATSGTVGQFDHETINEVIEQVSRIVEDNSDEYRQLVDRIGELARMTTAQEQQLRDLLDRGAELTATLRSRDREVLALAETAGRVIDRLIERRQRIASLLGDGSETVDRFADVIATNREALQTTIEQLDQVLAVTDPHLDQLNHGLALTPPALLEVAESGDGGDWLHVIIDHLILLPKVR